MTRKECLDAAAGCVLRDRASEYGGVEDNFRIIGEFWSAYVGRRITSWDVAAMMALLKIARAKANPKHDDNWTDLAGYAACGAECAKAQERFDKAMDGFQMESFKRSFPPEVVERLLDVRKMQPVQKAEGCEELVSDAPQSKEELMHRIVECNPATYPNLHPDRLRPHTPTGEELAEAFEEVADAAGK